jgi:acetyl-CoA synthetase
MNKNIQINSEEEYYESYEKSVKDPEKFWDSIARTFYWRKEWSKSLEWDFTIPNVKWFQGGKLNISENCLDRHLESKSNDPAITWVPNDPNDEKIVLSYGELHKKVCQFANVLKNNKIEKGDRVCLYMPMIPELAIAMLACARIGAIHSIVFAGFSSRAIARRINDSSCKMLITTNEMYRGPKVIPLKEICDQALKDCPSIEKVIVYNRTESNCAMKKNRDVFWHSEIKKVSDENEAGIMDAEDVLFILYTSGSTGKPKGMVHTTGGYMVGATYTFLNVFQIKPGDIYWCTADIGWITGHSYIVYGPLCAGAHTVMFEGVPSYPDYGRFWKVVEDLKVTHFYTAPTAIRALEKQDLSFVKKYDLSSIKVLGTVGEPINHEAWEWYHQHIGNNEAPIVDTWWQTETGGIMISSLAGITPQKSTYATLPLPGVQPVLMNDQGNMIEEMEAEGRLAIQFPWPSMARSIWGDHDRYKDIYFSTFDGKYFTGDGALRDKNGYYRITGRVDDIVIVSGHNLGTAPIENSIDEHPKVVECAVVGFPHAIKGNALYGFMILYHPEEASDELKLEINELISKDIGPIAKLDKIQFVNGLPKTRSGKIMRRILRKIAGGDTENLGDTSTLLNPEVVDEIIAGLS